MQTAIKKIGNSSGIILPKAVLAHLHVAPGDMIDIDLEQGRLVLSPAPRRPRAGWEEAAKALADAGDDGAVWPFFTNEGDGAL
jgi:antitoxin MazE